MIMLVLNWFDKQQLNVKVYTFKSETEIKLSNFSKS